MKTVNLKASMLMSLTLVSVVGFSGCSQLNAISKTSDQIDRTNDQIQKTNATLDKTQASIDKTANGVDYTAGGVYDQRVAIPFIEALKPENWDVLTPVPFRLMPYGTKIGRAINADDLIELVYLEVKSIREGKVNKDMDPLTGDTLYWTPDEARTIFKEKTATLTLLQVIAGMAYDSIDLAAGKTKDAVIDDIVKAQIIGDGTDGAGRYRETALQILNMRCRFLKDVQLDNTLLAEKITNMGQISQAIYYADQIEHIARMSFASEIQLDLKSSINYLPAGATDSAATDWDLSDKFNFAKEMPALWAKLEYLAQNVHDNGGTVAATSDDPDHVVTQMTKEAALKEIAANKAYWAGQNTPLK